MYLLIKDRRQAMKGFAKGFTGSVRMLASASFLLIEMAFVLDQWLSHCIIFSCDLLQSRQHAVVGDCFFFSRSLQVYLKMLIILTNYYFLTVNKIHL